MSDILVGWFTFMNHLDRVIPMNNVPMQRMFNEIYYLRQKVPGDIQINADGKLVWHPIFIQQWRSSVSRELPKPRTTSLIRFLRWLSQHEPTWGDGTAYQPIQDILVEWARSTLDTSKFSYELVSGEGLVEAYNTGPKSCMKGKTSQLQLYSSNPDRVSLVKIMVEGVYKGRALLWTLDSGNKFLDRIYPGNDVMAAWMRSVATEQGWIYKKVDSVGGEVANADAPLLVTVKHPRNRRIPYLDTMHKIAAVGPDYITLTSDNRKDEAGNMVWLEDVGDYIGTSEIYMGARFKYLDGTPVAKRYLPLSGNREYMRCQPYEPDGWCMIRRGQTWSKRYLKSEDRVYVMKGNRRRIDVVMGDDGFYYNRKDTRKSPKTGVFKPRLDATKLVLTDTTLFDNGAVMFHMQEVQE